MSAFSFFKGYKKYNSAKFCKRQKTEARQSLTNSGMIRRYSIVKAFHCRGDVSQQTFIRAIHFLQRENQKNRKTGENLDKIAHSNDFNCSF